MHRADWRRRTVVPIGGVAGHNEEDVEGVVDEPHVHPRRLLGVGRELGGGGGAQLLHHDQDEHADGEGRRTAITPPCEWQARMAGAHMREWHNMGVATTAGHTGQHSSPTQPRMCRIVSSCTFPRLYSHLLAHVSRRTALTRGAQRRAALSRRECRFFLPTHHPSPAQHRISSHLISHPGTSHRVQWLRVWAAGCHSCFPHRVRHRDGTTVSSVSSLG